MNSAACLIAHRAELRVARAMSLPIHRAQSGTQLWYRLLPIRSIPLQSRPRVGSKLSTEFSWRAHHLALQLRTPAHASRETPTALMSAHAACKAVRSLPSFVCHLTTCFSAHEVTTLSRVSNPASPYPRHAHPRLSLRPDPRKTHLYDLAPALALRQLVQRISMQRDPSRI